MPLFRIQDDDRPMHVVAKNFSNALNFWVEFVAEENKIEDEEVAPPLGVSFICDDDELLIKFNDIKLRGYQGAKEDE